MLLGGKRFGSRTKAKWPTEEYIDWHHQLSKCFIYECMPRCINKYLPNTLLLSRRCYTSNIKTSTLVFILALKVIFPYSKLTTRFGLMTKKNAFSNSMWRVVILIETFGYLRFLSRKKSWEN